MSTATYPQGRLWPGTDPPGSLGDDEMDVGQRELWIRARHLESRPAGWGAGEGATESTPPLIKARLLRGCLIEF